MVTEQASDVQEQPLLPPRAIIRPARTGIQPVRASFVRDEKSERLSHGPSPTDRAPFANADVMVVDRSTGQQMLVEAKAFSDDAAARKPLPNGNWQLAQWQSAGILSNGRLLDVFTDPGAHQPVHRARVFCSLNRDSVRYAQGGLKAIAVRLASNAAEVEGGQRLREVEEAAQEVAARERAPRVAADSHWFAYLRALRDSDELRERVLALASEVSDARSDANAPTDRHISRAATVDWRAGTDVGLRFADGAGLVLPMVAARDAGLLRLGAPAIAHFAVDGGRLLLEQVEPGLTADMGYLPARGAESGPEVLASRLSTPRDLHRGGAVRLAPEQERWLSERRLKRQAS